MTYGLEWGRKVRRKEAAGKEACRIQPRLNPIPSDVEGELHTLILQEERHICHRKTVNRERNTLCHSKKFDHFNRL